MQAQERPLEHALAEPPAPADVPQPLNQHSLCRLMKDRLRELGQNTLGSKRVLWTRIQETERKIAEEVACRAAIQREQEARASGATSSSALPVPAPKKSSEFEQQIHDLTHTPAADWRELCVMGHGAEKLHKRVDFDKTSPHATVGLQVRVQEARAPVRTILSTGKLRDSASVGELSQSFIGVEQS